MSNYYPQFDKTILIKTSETLNFKALISLKVVIN